MLNENEKNIIQQTVPVLQEKGVAITSYFYKSMFNQHPELKNMFNQTNQKKGLQSTALAQSVLAAAMNIEDLTRILPVVEEIAYKHCALQVPPAGYEIVGKHLLEAIQEVLDLDSEDEIVVTWGKAYQEIADVFIKVEQQIYEQMAWKGFESFEILQIEQVSTDIKSFTVKSEQFDFSHFTPGQFITVDIESEHLPYRAKRHYSIIEGNNDTLTFAVKRDTSTEHEGEVSIVLHDEYKVGDQIQLSAPVGAFSIQNETHPQLFIGSGIGVTPLIPMFKQLSKGENEVNFIQNTSDINDVPFEETLTEIAESGNNSSYVIYDKRKNGYINESYLKNYINDETEIYVCGGQSFLQSMIETLKAMGIAPSKIHFESFIPKLSIQA